MHPNIARLAASYDEIFARYAHGQISAAKATDEVLTLVARDDEGTQWSIDPRTGGFLRKTRSGELIPDEPPTYGLATPTPHEVSPGRAFNPDINVELTPVTNEVDQSGNPFAGSTRLTRQPIPGGYQSPLSRFWSWLRSLIRPNF